MGDERMSSQAVSIKLNFVAVSFLFVALLCQLVVRLQVLQTCYEIESVRVNALEYDSELRDLKMQFAVLTRPESLAVEAENRLALTTTNRDELRAVKERG